MSEYVQLVGTDVPGAIGSCCLVADERRILFNCPEGSQRAMSEGRLRIGKVSTFLFTRIEVSSIMGLPGFLFSINDCGVRRCYAGGPLNELLAVLETTWRCFFGFRNLICEVPNFSAQSVTPSPIRVEGGFKLARSQHTPAEETKDERNDGTIPPTVVHNVTCNANDWYRVPGTLLFNITAGTVEVTAFFVGFGTTNSMRATPTPIVGYILLEKEKVVFDAAKAKALGVKPGPKFAKLKAGFDVESDSSPIITVKASDVARSQPGSVFSLVVDTNDVPMLQSALAYLFSQHPFVGASTGPALQNVFHLAPPAVTSTIDYMQSIANTAWWSATFPAIAPVGCNVDHANTTSHRGFTGFPTALVHRMHLNALAPSFFPFPASYQQNGAAADPTMWPYANRFRLGAGAKKPVGAPLPPDELVVRYPDSDMAMAMLSETFRAQYMTDVSASPSVHSDAYEGSAGDVTFLGTGSSIPSKYRNVSGIVVKLPTGAASDADVRVVLDCGEGTVGQLYSQCAFPTPANGAGEGAAAAMFCGIMSSIEVVFISHSHADHNLGLFSMLEHMVAARRAQRTATSAQKPMVVVAPADFLDFVSQVGLLDLDMLRREEGLQLDVFSSNGPMLPRCPLRGQLTNAAPCPGHLGDALHHLPPPSKHLPAMQSWCDLRGYLSDVFPVDHPAHAHGIVVQRRPSGPVEQHKPFALLYSGDTRPNDLLVQRGLQYGPLDVLIHEATFDDALAAEAKRKSHSTTGEAIDVARRMNAKTVLLTHFSQRYPKLPPPSASANHRENGQLSGDQPRVVFAFDYMCIPLEVPMLTKLSNLTPTFVALLVEYDSWESGTSKRLREEV